MKLFFIAALGGTFAQQETAEDYQYEEVIGSTVEATTIFFQADTTATTVSSEYEYEDYQNAMANDVGLADTEEEEEEEEAIMTGFARTGGTSGSVAPPNQATLELLANKDFRFTWDYDASHATYLFEYQELVGNYQHTGEYVTFESSSISMTTDSITTTTELTPPAEGVVYRWKITVYDASGSEATTEIQGQSFTDDIVHQVGDVYEGGGGYAAQVLLPTSFDNAKYEKTSASDSYGYVIAVKVLFPAGCPTISVDADVDGNYVYTDPAITDPHRIFIFPQTHFSNQFSGPIKAFHYYVSGAAYTGCDLSDPGTSVTVSVENTDYLVRTNEAADVDLMAMWPSDVSYPPVQYTEQHVVNMTDLIQPASHIGPSRALSAPRVFFSSGSCDITLNVEDGTSPGWGMVNEFDSYIDMTDLWSAVPTSNTGTQFKLQALEWLTQVGVTFRYDTSIVGCETILTSASIEFLELDVTDALVKAVNPTY